MVRVAHELDLLTAPYVFTEDEARAMAGAGAVMDVTLKPGGGHPFHRHPDQEEVIWIREGRIEQWLEDVKQELGSGEAVYIPRDVVHASFTIGDAEAKLSVILTPTAGDDGYSVIDVFEEEPWASLRP
jgi:quercetin dioxygenase-like cupin family protein